MLADEKQGDDEMDMANGSRPMRRTRSANEKKQSPSSNGNATITTPSTSAVRPAQFSLLVHIN
jgi:hypothetical protein